MCSIDTLFAFLMLGFTVLSFGMGCKQKEAKDVMPRSVRNQVAKDFGIKP